MEIIHESKEDRGVFLAKEGDTIIGELTYFQPENDRMMLDYTFVSPAYRGMGIGQKLVEKAVEYARKNQLYLTPVCSYAKKVFDRNPSFDDVRK